MNIHSLMQGGFLLVFALSAFADSLDVWQWRNPTPTGNTFGNVVYANDRFFACGGVGAMMTSTNGMSWTAERTGTAATLNSVSYGNGLYVAVGSGGTILTSPDGKAWSPQASSAGTTNLVGITFGQNQFVIVGGNYNGVIMTSTNGTNWTTRFFGGYYGPLAKIASGNNLFVAAGGSLPGSVLVSNDGVTWTSQQVGDNVQISSQLTYALGRFYSSGAKIVNPFPVHRIHSSTNGTNWTLATTPASGSSPGVLFSGNGSVIFQSFTNLFFSQDGENFPQLPTSNYTNVASAGAIGGGKFVTVGGAVQVSSDATNWARIGPIGPTTNLMDIARGNGMYVAVGGSALYLSGPGGILASPDGRSFAGVNTPFTSSLFRVHFGNGVFHAVGDGGLILRSTNGLSWAQRNSATSDALFGIASGNGLLVAVGRNGTIVTSPNGLAWTQRFSGTDNDLFGITHGQNAFVAVGYFGTVMTSPDGLNWTAQFNELTAFFRNVTFAGGQFVAVGDAGAISTSPNGSDWTTRNSGTTANLSGISYASGTYVAVGNSELITSGDGITWTRRYPNFTTSLTGISYFDHSFYVVGSSGTIVQSALVDATQLSGQRNSLTGNFDLTIQSPPGSSFWIQARETFSGAWNNLALITNSAASVLYSDLASATKTQRFYRTAFQ